jgi:Asp-tRNA(Asn)/Glu-tRNA(Gln) amidotransferase C subunit
MSIERATVRRIARLARIAIGEGDLDSAAAEMSRVLDLAGQLAAAETAASSRWRTRTSRRSPGAPMR